ncbi:response regulator transcription factor [Kitasatospora sp. NPDC004531]
MRSTSTVVECDPELSPMERQLLVLLAQGLTDAAAAKRLSVSVRTERRMVAELMHRLGASSRFDAGVRAARRRWI